MAFQYCRKGCQEDYPHPDQLDERQAAGSDSRIRLSGSSFMICSVEEHDGHRGRLAGLLHGLLNSPFYPLELVLKHSGDSVRIATDAKRASCLRIALRRTSSAQPPEQGAKEHCAA